MLIGQVRDFQRPLTPAHSSYSPCPLMAAVGALLLACIAAPAQQPGGQAGQSPRYSIGIPSFDDIPVDAIPPAAAPIKREPPKPAPKAKSPEEAAAFDQVAKEQRPDERIKLVEDFLLAYPDSESKQAVYLAASEAYRRKNDLARMLTYAELTLAENPENIQALLTLAESLPDSVRRDDPDFIDRLEEAREYAQKGLELIGKSVRPAGATPEQWQRTRKQVESAARLALALTAMMREDYAAAEAEYIAAFKLMEKPDALSLYRLGLTHSFLKKYNEAIDALRKSAEAGGVNSRTTAGASRDLVAEALAFVEKQKAAASPVDSATEVAEESGPGKATEATPPVEAVR